MCPNVESRAEETHNLDVPMNISNVIMNIEKPSTSIPESTIVIPLEVSNVDSIKEETRNLDP